MKINQAIRHSVYIGRAQNWEFSWGRHDCLTFLFGWYDYVFGTDHLAGIQNEYDSTSSALRFWRNFPMSVSQWMHLRGFERVVDDTIQEGDVRIIDQDKRWFPSAYIYHNGGWWTVSESGGARALTPDSMNNARTVQWRQHNG